MAVVPAEPEDVFNAIESWWGLELTAPNIDFMASAPANQLKAFSAYLAERPLPSFRQPPQVAEGEIRPVVCCTFGNEVHNEEIHAAVFISTPGRVTAASSSG